MRQIHGGLGAYAGAIEARLRSTPSTRVRTSCPVTRIIYNNASRKYVIESREAAVQQKGEPLYGGAGSGTVPMHAYGGGMGQPQVGCWWCGCVMRSGSLGSLPEHVRCRCVLSLMHVFVHN